MGSDALGQSAALRRVRSHTLLFFRSDRALIRTFQTPFSIENPDKEKMQDTRSKHIPQLKAFIVTPNSSILFNFTVNGVAGLSRLYLPQEETLSYSPRA